MHSQDIGDVVQHVMDGARKATIFLSPDFVAKATFKGRRDGDGQSKSILFTYGKPNYAERVAIQKIKADGYAVKFPQIVLRTDGV